MRTSRVDWALIVSKTKCIVEVREPIDELLCVLGQVVVSRLAICCENLMAMQPLDTHGRSRAGDT